MNLLDLRLSLRKRRLDEIFDLGLIVLRRNYWRYLRIVLPFMAVFIAANYGLNLILPANRSIQNGVILACILTESSIIQLFLTALNGRIVFEIKPRFRDVLGDVRGVIGLYLVRVVLINTSCYTLLLPFVVPAIRALLTHFFLGEALILERLRGSALSGRAAALSRGQGDRVAGFFMFSVFIFLAGLVCSVYALDSLREMMGDWATTHLRVTSFDPSGLVFQFVFFPIVVYLSLCRFLLYLDTRIEGEGWDIELMLARGIEETEREPEAIEARRKSA